MTAPVTTSDTEVCDDRIGAVEAAGVEYLPEEARDSGPRNLAAVFLGTAVVQPGAFNPIGTMVAIYFLTTGIFGLQLLGYAGWIQNIFYGAGLVVAVALAKVVRDRSRAR